VVTMRGMSLLTWVSLLFLVVALVGSIAYAASRGLRAWRTFRRFSKTTSAAIESVMERAAEAEEHAVAFTEGTDRLNEALVHLEQSRAELAVIQAAAGEARSSLTSLRGAVPRK
jgi:flagellar hook-basal body complex protein FliE